MYPVFPNSAISCVFDHGPVGVGKVLVSSFERHVPTEVSVFHHDMDCILLAVLERLSRTDRTQSLAMSDP